ncbi:virion morphogenesis protein [Spartinivicinus ruber]|uniref:virion morphogenesis protein n=1 Tax=Spartinivicinus ruber TaxID=2683272 RepID=UPI0013CFC8C4|nr:virion morphogenesis protein [Spartinivicinus ruber]
MPAPASPIRLQHNGLSAIQQLELLQLPANKKRKLLWKAGKAVQKNSRARIRQQKDLTGRSFKARKNKRKRKKMLRGLGRTLGVKANAQQAEVGWQNPLSGQIAKRQQEGLPQTMTKQQLPAIPRSTYDGACSKAMAKALIRAGYTIKRQRGSGRKRPTIAWITQHLTFGIAGAILRELLNKPQQSRWRIPLEARPFLGATNQEINQLLADQLQQLMHAMR